MNELSDKILPKKSIQSLVSYRPQVKEEINSNQIRLSVNEGALGIGPKAKNAIPSMKNAAIAINGNIYFLKNSLYLYTYFLFYCSLGFITLY